MARLLSVFFLVALSLTHVTWAADSAAHQHGTGMVNVLSDGPDLLLEVRLPAIDVIGFEHSPRDEKQTALVRNVLARFELAEPWFTPSRQALCTLENAQASLVGLSTTTFDGNGKSGVAHSHQAIHAHQDTDRHQDDDAHADFEGSLQYHCAKPDRLRQVSVSLFRLFPGVGKLDVQLVTAQFQVKRSISAQKPVLTFSQEEN